MRNWIAKFALLALLLLAPAVLLAQDVSTITGLVKDASGALIPGTTVVLSNPSKGTSYKATTNSEGSYRFAEIPAGPGYKLVFAHSGFAAYAVTGVYLDVANTRTQNATLSAGSSEQIEVSATGQSVTINTEDATIGNNFEVQVLNTLPVQIRDTPLALFYMQPGVTEDQATGQASVTGARTDQTHVTLDGLDVDDRGTGQFGAVNGNAPVDSVQEFRGVTAGATASFDSGGGGQFQLVTKSGTNHFHGSLFEYHRDTTTEANDWFNNNAGVPRAKLIRNQFGGNVGGPILKDKLFFFFEYNGRRDNQGAQVERAVPTSSYLEGNISYINAGDGCGESSNLPAQCISTYSAAQVKALDPLAQGQNAALAQYVAGRYPASNDPTGGDKINTAGFRFNAPVILKENDYVAKIDYNLTSNQKIFVRGSVLSQRQGDAVNYSAPVEFPGDPTSRSIDDASWSYVVGHNWAISANKSNAFSYGEVRSRLNFPALYNPTGPIYYTTGSGNYSAPSAFGPLAAPYLGNYNAQGRTVPLQQFRDDFVWQKGNHNLQFGGTFKFAKTFSNLILNDFTPSLGIGGGLSQLNPSFRPADINTGSSTAATNWDNAFTFDLGRFAALGATYNYDASGGLVDEGAGATRQYRYYETELYLDDTWKATPSLTLSYGLRYQLYSVPYETSGIESVQVNANTGKPYGFDDYFQTRLAQSAAGQSGINSLPFMQYVLGGKANHGASGYYQPSYKDFAPRFAFSYNPSFDRKTVFNGSIGIVYDHTIVSAVQNFQDHSSYLFQSATNVGYGTSGDISGSLASGPRFQSLNSIPTPQAPAPFSSSTIPYVDDSNGDISGVAGYPYGLSNGQSFNTAIDPNLKTPYSIMLNFGFQHDMGSGFILKMNYAGRLGRRLLAQVDASQIIDFPSGGQQYSAAFTHIIQEVRAGADPTNLPAEPWFETAVIPGIGQSNGFANNTSLVASTWSSYVFNGDMGDFTQAMASAFGPNSPGLLNPNVAMASQFASNDFYTNKGFSAYHGLLVTLSKNAGHGLQFDLNYTWSHSVDNMSLVANGQANFTGEFICDVTRPRECRGSSDFDITHTFNGNFVYDLPFGKGKPIGGASPFWLNEVIGGWQLSGLPTWQTGTPYNANSTAYLAGFATLAPALLVGQKALVSSHVHKDPSTGVVYGYSDVNAANAAFTGPVGLNVGSRNNLRAPRYANLDLGLGKTFPLYRETKLIFRADAFNSLNHPSFAAPNATIVSTGFGQITGTNSTPRVLQFALRLEY